MPTSGQANAVVGQSGGPTAVINQSLVGVIEAAKASLHIGNLLGARHGVKGILREDFIPLNEVPEDLLERIASTPASALGSTRDKPDQAYCERIFEVFAKRSSVAVASRVLVLPDPAAPSITSNRPSPVRAWTTWRCALSRL